MGAAYHATRTALLHVLERCGGYGTVVNDRSRLTGSSDHNSASYRTQSKKNLKIPTKFQELDQQAQVDKNPIRVTAKKPKTKSVKHVTFFVCGKTGVLSQEDIVWQMACAYRKMARCRVDIVSS